MPSTDRHQPSLPARLVARYGRNTLIVLGLVLVAGFGLRAGHVIWPDPSPGDDALAYRALAESLYTEGSYGSAEFKTPSDWSPGAPLLYAGSYYLTGGVRDGVARGVEALLGTGTILVVFLLAAALTGYGRRAGPEDDQPPDAGGPGPLAPLLAAALVAFYPPFVTGPGSLMSEPPAEFTLPAAVLAVIWADRRDGLAAWLVPGLLLGLTVLIRPEYMLVTAALALVVLVRVAVTRGGGRAVLATAMLCLAAVLPVIPWTVHNYVTLDRVVPVTTGSGKALFTGSYRPGDGEYQRVKAALLEEQTGEVLAPGSPALDAVDPVPLFNRVAMRYPQLERDAALGRVGRENLRQYLREDPFGYAAMTVRKAWRMWGSSSGGPLANGFGALVHKLLVVFGLAGLALLAWRRRWEAAVLVVPVFGITGVAAITLAPPRRNQILMTLVLPLASVALAALYGRLARYLRARRSGQPPAPAPKANVP